MEYNVTNEANGLGFNVGISSKPITLGLDLGAGSSNTKEKTTYNNNSNLVSTKGNITLTANKRDINIISSNIKAEENTIAITAGNDLNVETKVNKEIRKTEGFNTKLGSSGIGLGFNNADKDISKINTRAGIESKDNNINVKGNITLTAANVGNANNVITKNIKIHNKDKQFNTSLGVSIPAIQKDKTEHPKGTINLSLNYKNKETDEVITKDKEVIQKEVNNELRLDNLVIDTRLLTKDGRSNIEDTVLNATDVILDTTESAIDFLIPDDSNQEQLIAATIPLPGIIPDPTIVIPVTGAVLLARQVKKGLDKAREKVQDRREEENHPKRSIHRGKHWQSVSDKQAEKLTEIVEQGEKEGWGQEQYRDELKKFTNEERQRLRSGNTDLNSINRHNPVGGK